MQLSRSVRVGSALVVGAVFAFVCMLLFERGSALSLSPVERQPLDTVGSASPHDPSEPSDGPRSTSAQRAAATDRRASTPARTAARVSGVTLGSGGAALVGARVVLSVLDASGAAQEFAATSGPGGAFSLEIPLDTSACFVRSAADELGAFVVLAGSDQLEDLVLRHDPMGEIRVFVVDEFSVPVAGARLIARPAPEDERLASLGCEPIVVRTQHDGGARLEVPWSVPTVLHAASEVHGVGRTVVGAGTDSAVLQLARPMLHVLHSLAAFVPEDRVATVEVVSFGEYESGTGDGLPSMLPLRAFSRGIAVEASGSVPGVLQVRLAGRPVLGLCPAAGEEPVAFCSFDEERGGYGPWRKLEETRLRILGTGHREGHPTVGITGEVKGTMFSIAPDVELTDAGEWLVDTGHVGLGGTAKVELEVSGTERTRFVGAFDLQPGLHPVAVTPVTARFVPVIVTVIDEGTGRPLGDRLVTVTETGASRRPWRADFMTDARGQFSYPGDPERSHEYRSGAASSAGEFVLTMSLDEAERASDGRRAVTLSVPTAQCRVTFLVGELDGPHRFALANLDRAEGQEELRLECTQAHCQRAAWEELALIVDAEGEIVEATLPAGRYAAYLMPLTAGVRFIDIRLTEVVSSRSYRATAFEVRDEERLRVQLVGPPASIGSGATQAFIEVAGLTELVSDAGWSYELWTASRGAKGLVLPSRPMNPDQYQVTGDTIAVACDVGLLALLRVQAEEGFAQSIPLFLEPSLTERVDLGFTVTVRPRAGSVTPIAGILTCQATTSRTSRSGEVFRATQQSRVSIAGIELEAGHMFRGVAPGSTLSLLAETVEGSYRGQSLATSKRLVDSVCVLSPSPR